MPRIIALMALIALELSDVPVHEPVHVVAPVSAHLVTVRNIVKSVRPKALGRDVCPYGAGNGAAFSRQTVPARGKTPVWR